MYNVGTPLDVYFQMLDAINIMKKLHGWWAELKVRKAFDHMDQPERT